MTLFQWIVGPSLALLAVREVVRSMRRGWRLISVARFVIWSVAAVLVVAPNLTVPMAKLLGIERGVDLVVYCFLIASSATTLYFYGRQDRLERKLVKLTRDLALDDVRRGASTPQPSELRNEGDSV